MITMANYSCSQKKKAIIFPQKKILKGMCENHFNKQNLYAFVQQMAYSVYIYFIIYSLVNSK